MPGRRKIKPTNEMRELATPKTSDKRSFLSELENVSQSNTPKTRTSDFSVKNIKRRDHSILDTPVELDIDNIQDIGNLDNIQLSDNVWNKIIDKYENMSPIEDITRDGMMSYKRNGDGDRYDAMFKKELAMLSEVLSSLNTASKIVDKKISFYKDKGKTSSGGVMKSFSDIITAQNSLQQTKMQAIKSMADIKKSAEDLRMKNDKINPTVEEDNDSIADNFYKSIINGGRDNFIKNAMSNISQSQDIQDNQTNHQEFNISQPNTYINTSDNNYQYNNDSESNNIDEFGYIRHEYDDIQVCIERLPDGGMVFVAINNNGEPVDDYELPDSSLTDTISIPPMSNFGYDKFGRKYKIIDAGGDVDISDVIDDEF